MDNFYNLAGEELNREVFNNPMYDQGVDMAMNKQSNTFDITIKTPDNLQEYHINYVYSPKDSKWIRADATGNIEKLNIGRYTELDNDSLLAFTVDLKNDLARVFAGQELGQDEDSFPIEKAQPAIAGSDYSTDDNMSSNMESVQNGETDEIPTEEKNSEIDAIADLVNKGETVKIPSGAQSFNAIEQLGFETAQKKLAEQGISLTKIDWL